MPFIFALVAFLAAAVWLALAWPSLGAWSLLAAPIAASLTVWTVVLVADRHLSA